MYNGEIHILGSMGSTNYTKHVKSNGSDLFNWSDVSTLPFNRPYAMMCAVYKGEIHVIHYTSHYAWNGSSWRTVSTPPLGCYKPVAFNKEWHAFGYNKNAKHCIWNGSEWRVNDVIDYAYSTGVYVATDTAIHV